MIPALRRPDNGITKEQMPIQLPPNSMQEAEYQYTVWAAHIPPNTPAVKLLEPGYWALYAAKFKPFDEVRARSEDGTWMARFVVLEAARTWARLQMLELHNLGTQDVSLTKAASQDKQERRNSFEVKHRGPRGWSVLNKTNSQVMHEGETSKAGAEKWLDDHLATTEVTTAPSPATA